MMQCLSGSASAVRDDREARARSEGRPEGSIWHAGHANRAVRLCLRMLCLVAAHSSVRLRLVHSTQFFGKCLLGKIESGTVRTGDPLVALDPSGKVIENVRHGSAAHY